jgi:hypothetical protein
MELPKKLRVFLEENHVEYTHTVHPLACTAREVASAEHLPSREVAKTVVAFGDEAGGFSGGAPDAGSDARTAGGGRGNRTPVPGLRDGGHAAPGKPVRHAR